MFVLFIDHFWTRNRQILNFEHFELVLARFYSVKRAFSTKWWPGEENTPKIIFFCIFGLLSYRYNLYQVGLEFNFLIFWCALVHLAPPQSWPSLLADMMMHLWEASGVENFPLYSALWSERSLQLWSRHNKAKMERLETSTQGSR